MSDQIKIYNPSGKHRVLVTKPLVGSAWLEILTQVYDCRVDHLQTRTLLTAGELQALIKGDGSVPCAAVLGQLTEPWNKEMFTFLKQCGGKAYSNLAVGFDNVDVAAATELGIPVGNTPGVLTEATAEMAASLVYACARRVVEADRFMRAGLYKVWLPDLFIGTLMHRKTLGIVGAGRIGSALALMLVRANKMDLIYYDKFQNKKFEDTLDSFNDHLKSVGDAPIKWKKVEDLDVLLTESDIISLHPNLDKSTHHMIDATALSKMKPHALLVNCARGPVINEEHLVQHCRSHPHFFAGLDVYENEPAMKPGLADLDNVVIVPHIASATEWTRSAMSIMAACNIGAMLAGAPAWGSPDIMPFVTDEIMALEMGNAEKANQIVPRIAPSILNAKELGIQLVMEISPKL